MTTYSINLDDMDLALLPLHTHTYNDFLKKEHFQFHVIKETPLEPTTYTCHICAIELPAAFAREHATSIKHRANARIASEAARRTRALINDLPPPAAAQMTARFCANCATIVDDDHDRTKEHRVAAMHDNLLWELMKTYVGDDEDDQHSDNNKILNVSQIVNKNVDENNKMNGTIVAQAVNKNQRTNETEDKTENSESKVAQHTVNCDKNNKKNNDEALDKAGITNNINKTDITQSTNSVLPTTTRWVKLECKKEENGTSKNEPGNLITKEAVAKGDITKLTKEPYEKELRKFMDTNNLFQIKEIYHRVIITINEDTVNVYSDHFHSFHRMSKNGKVECIVCNKTFEGRNIETHKYDLNHMSAVAKIGHDGNYVREINETHSHCILCNHQINNINVSNHKHSHSHLVRMKNNVKSNAKTNETTTENNNNGVTHDKTENNPINKDVTMKESVEINKHPYKIVSGELQCVVCDCRVPRDLKNREDHLKGFRHVNNLKTI